MLQFLRLPFLTRPARTSQSHQTFRPRLEELEDRFCPSSTQIALNAEVLPGHQVTLSGTLTGDNVAYRTVNFSGAASGMLMSDMHGNFSYTTGMASLGTVYATGTDMDTAQATITDSAPAVSMSISYGAQKSVTITGHVTDVDAAYQCVSFSGAAMGMAFTDSSGNFSFTTSDATLGQISAVTTDLWGQTSNTATVTVASTGPLIQNFIAVHVSGNTWTFQGQVVDENAEGLTIRFGGTMFNGETTTVRADGTFSLTITLAEGATGTATAITTDWWGQESSMAYTELV